MNFVGIDLHKKSITVCVVDQARNIVDRKRLLCSDPSRIEAYIRQWCPAQAVVEATASYEWLLKLIDPLTDRVVLAHPRKMRVIAESTRKSDKLDAQVLAEFLAMDMVPEAHCPTPRQREHRRLVRHRQYVRGRLTSVLTKIRRMLSDYNADRPDLFTRRGLTYLEKIQISAADRFVVNQLLENWRVFTRELNEIDAELRRFAASAPPKEAEARALLDTIPGVGPVTIDVVVSELADVDRFRSQKHVCSYAGLAPGHRESGEHRLQLGITKQGSRWLRWILVEAAWQLVRRTARWREVFDSLKRRKGAKKAIVAVARRLLCVMLSMLQGGRAYRHAMV